jgi:membrane-associated protease RseP (regulator of RpoE activity)
MKKLLLAAALLTVGLSGTAFGAQVFTTTIKNTTIKQVQDVSLEYMMEKNFAIDRVEDYTLTFTKGFGDGFFLVSRNMTVKFNMLQRDGDVKLMVTQFEGSPEMARAGQRAIEHLIPLIRDIRHSIDGTPIDQIENEAVNRQSGLSIKPAQKTKTSGLSFKASQIYSVEPDSIADKAGLKPGDDIIEINGKPTDEKALKDIDARLGSGRSVVIVYGRDGDKHLATLK